jgi:hypothetical protein
VQIAAQSFGIAFLCTGQQRLQILARGTFLLVQQVDGTERVNDFETAASGL